MQRIRQSRLLALAAIGNFVCACSGDTAGTRGTVESPGGDETRHERPAGEVVPETPEAVPTDGSCECPVLQVCTVEGTCIDRPDEDQEIVGELELVHYQRPADTAIPTFGRADAEFFPFEPLPRDTRDKFTSDDGDPCALERGEERYPSNMAGAAWPTGLRVNAGGLTFTFASPLKGSKGVIQLDPFRDAEGGFRYGLGHTPPELRDGTSAPLGWFAPQHLPADTTFELDVAGNTQLGPASLSGFAMPATFSVTAPPRRGAGRVSVLKGLTIRWTPAQANAVMEVQLAKTFKLDGGMRLRCLAKDDGVLTLPPDAVRFFSGEVSLILSRRLTRYQELKTSAGERFHLYVTGRHTVERGSNFGFDHL